MVPSSLECCCSTAGNGACAEGAIRRPARVHLPVYNPRHMSFQTGPLVLIYSPFFEGFPNLFKLNCETTCCFTADRQRLPEADVVLFHLPTMRGLEFPKRYPGQRWALFSMESSVNYPALADRKFMRQ